MAQQPPLIKDDPLYKLLRDGSIKEFNERKTRGEKADLRGADFHRVDLRGMDADGLDLSNCYFRMCDLRGLDLTKAKLEGA
ncbi:MAG: pentapeptide repeat-containing protein, partial [Gammaproteobacteria bacterium]|nr:pentapeptide repeat-containing protein [Gammaproteobacteria bacterium]